MAIAAFVIACGDVEAPEGVPDDSVEVGEQPDASAAIDGGAQVDTGDAHAPDTVEADTDEGDADTDEGDADTDDIADHAAHPDGDAVDDAGPPWGGPSPLHRDATRPFVMFGADALPAIRTAVAREGSTAAVLWNRTISVCSREPRERPDDAVYSPVTEEWNANIARACAFVGLVGEDPEPMRRAADLLLGMRGDVRTVPFDLDLLDQPTIHGGPAVAAYAHAFDLLSASPDDAFPTPEDATRARELLLAHADELHDFYTVDWPGFLALTHNNHNIKHAAGIGMVGLAVPDDPGALRRLSFGVTESLDHIFDSQFLPGGGWAEGPGYLQYSAVSYLPFFHAVHRALAGETIELWHACAGAAFGTCEPGVRAIGDPWYDPRFETLHRWAFDMTMPDGTMAPLDDARRPRFPWAFVAAWHGDGPWGWAWWRGVDVPSTYSAVELAPDVLALGIDLEAATPPTTEPLSIVYADGGQAVLRSGWGEQDSYVVLLAEFGAARRGGHEHPDATSFSWFVGGDYALIDTGYLSFDNRLATAVASQHNLILVDDQGPPTGAGGISGVGVDSAFEGCVLEAPAPHCAVRTRYRDTDVTRRLVAVGDRALVLFDEVRRDAPARLTHVLHGGAAVEHTYPAELGARWDLPGGRVEAAVVRLEGPLAYEILDAVDGATPAGRHGAVHAATGAETSEAHFVSVLLRHAPDEEPPVFARSTADGAVELTVWSADGRELLSASTCAAPPCVPGHALRISGPNGLLADDTRDRTLAFPLALSPP